jgi:hypothetical protein
MEDADNVSMPTDPNVVQYKLNNGLAINEQNGIPYVTYIGKLLGATHAMQPDILYATVMMAQEDWTGVKRILRYLKRTIDLHSPVEERGELEMRAHFFVEFEENGQANRDVSRVNRVTWPTQKVICPSHCH